MTTKEIIKQAGDYMRGILADSNAIREKYQVINDLKMELSLTPAPSITKYDSKKGNGYAVGSSSTSGTMERLARLEKKLRIETNKVKTMELNLFHTMISLQHTMILTHVEEWTALELLYFKGMTQREAGREMGCSGAMVNKIKNIALLSIGSVVLGLRAAGEYYDEKGLYIDFTPGQKKRIQEGITLI